MRRVHRVARRVSRRLELQHHRGYPREVQLVPSNACNIRCMQCPKTWYETDNRILRRPLYERVRDELFDHVEVVNLQGLGEPLLCPLFMEIAEEAALRDLKMRFVTNATYLTREKAKRLVKIAAQVTTSLDGDNSDTHEESRPGGDFNRVMEMLGDFHELRGRGANPGFSVGVNTVVTTLNVDELVGIMEIVIRHGVDSLTLINPGVGDRTDRFAHAAIGHHPERLRPLIPRLREMAETSGVDLAIPSFIEGGNGSGDGNVDGGRPGVLRGTRSSQGLFPGKCFDPWETVYIDVDGWVRPCCRALWIGMGNIMEESFLSIWNNEHYRRLRRSINSPSPPDFCRTCNTNWGINNGDEWHARRLEAAGVSLPEPPKIGVTQVTPSGNAQGV